MSFCIRSNRTLKCGIMSVWFGLLSVVAGCQYARLLQFKSQLSQVSTNFRFEVNNSGPIIRCLRPVLEPVDVLLITQGTSPNVTALNQGKITWQFIQKKQYSRAIPYEEAHPNLVITLQFNEKNRLESCVYPIQFTALFPSEMVSQLLSTIGTSKVGVQDRSLSSQQNWIRKEWLPTKQQIIQALGVPYEEIVSKNVTTLKYRYTIQQSEEPAQTWIVLRVRNSDEKVVFFSGTVFGPEMRCSFDHVQ